MHPSSGLLQHLDHTGGTRQPLPIGNTQALSTWLFTLYHIQPSSRYEHPTCCCDVILSFVDCVGPRTLCSLYVLPTFHQPPADPRPSKTLLFHGTLCIFHSRNGTSCVISRLEAIVILATAVGCLFDLLPGEPKWSIYYSHHHTTTGCAGEYACFTMQHHAASDAPSTCTILGDYMGPGSGFRPV